MAEPDEPIESRVRSRLVPLGLWAEELPERLERFFECRVRSVTAEELEQSSGDLGFLPRPVARTSVAVEPAWADAATLLLLRHELLGGDAVTLAFGTVGTERIPCCEECAVLAVSEPASEEDELVRAAEETVWTVTRGFAEFRWHYRDHTGRPDQVDPEVVLEQGWFGSSGGSARAGRDVVGDVFEKVWRPWPRRPGRTPVHHASQ